ncbi:unnamed protein product [[Candida] boidinii]|uniref:Unnamed protein product n=1 Tax=Candida boidinii TaxID=5477 RepID=A0A9W6WDJ5_CANBO|nr:unnamed protein product [[Candida] boidinii]
MWHMGRGDRHWSSTCGAWDGGGQCGDWSRNNDLWDGDWSSTGGDDGLSGDRNWSSTCGTWDGGGQCGNWVVMVTGPVQVEHGTVVVNVETGW